MIPPYPPAPLECCYDAFWVLCIRTTFPAAPSASADESNSGVTRLNKGLPKQPKGVAPLSPTRGLTFTPPQQPDPAGLTSSTVQTEHPDLKPSINVEPSDHTVHGLYANRPTMLETTGAAR